MSLMGNHVIKSNFRFYEWIFGFLEDLLRNATQELYLPFCTWNQGTPGHSLASCPSLDQAHTPGHHLPSQCYTVHIDTK